MREYKNIDTYVTEKWSHRLASRCYVSVGMGWIDVVNKAFLYLESLGIPYKVCDKKEKFGGLRFYFDFIDDRIPEGEEGHIVDVDQITWNTAYSEIHKLEAESFYVCEDCGDPGERYAKGGWIRTLCKAHQK